MTAEQLKKIFEQPYTQANWYSVLKDNFNVTTLRDKPVDITKRLAGNDYYNATAQELGQFETIDGHLIGIYKVELPKEKVKIHINRKGLRSLLNSVYSSDVEAALLVFVQDTKWRFSYVSEITVKNKATGKREKKATDPKRYTYLLGEGERCKTAADRFARVQQKEDLFAKGVTLEALEEAFNVDKMSKAFFNEYRKQYGKFTAYLTGLDENNKKVGDPNTQFTTIFKNNEKEARDFVKKMMGRIVFLYFLEKKGWLGVPPNGNWGDGDEYFLSNLFKHCNTKPLFYSNVLVPLFFETMNTDGRNKDCFAVDDALFTLPTGKPLYSTVKVPYLNGGLFEEDSPYTQQLIFEEQRFDELFTFFDQYNFTVYEDSPDEHTVAVDPEMLGHIFENLLEDNKEKGAFYTPKEIVHYMCRESLIEYLYTQLNPNAEKETLSRTAIEKLVIHHEASDAIEQDQAIVTALKKVKICDPAIGSGAFPMGLLMEIFYLVETMYYASPDVTADVWKLGKDWNPAAVKESIIQNSIYGVDIEKGAVDIARLRFWLSLVVDEDKPKALPNLDYKIVVGNSLLSKFSYGNTEEVIDIDWDTNTAKATEANRKIMAEQTANLNTLQAWQTAYFNKKGNKQKEQQDIRNKKIDILVNQLTLSKISHQQNNPILGGFAPTPKEVQKNLENELIQKGFDNTIAKLQALKKDATATLSFFDWKLDFPEIMNDKVAKGETGFDIVIGNPPYGAKFSDNDKKGLKKYKTTLTIKGIQKGSMDSYTIFIELGYDLLAKSGNLHYIVPISITSSESVTGVHNLLENNCDQIKVSSYSVRPQPVFENAVVNTSILFFKKTNSPVQSILSTKMYRKSKNFNLQHLVDNLEFINIKKTKLLGRYPKISKQLEEVILIKLLKLPNRVKDLIKDKGKPIYYRTTGGRYFKVITNYPTLSTKERPIFFEQNSNLIGAILSSNLFFWWYQIYSNNLDLKSYEIEMFPLPLDRFDKQLINKIESTYDEYLKDIESNANVRQTEKYANISSFKEYKIGKSKHLIDKIDDLICPIFGLTIEEIEFIKNYEIEYRIQDED